MHGELQFVGNVLAYRDGRQTTVEVRGRCASVPTWSLRPPRWMCRDCSVARRCNKRRCIVTQSSGNVFRDLGLPDADRLLAQAEASLRSASRRSRRPRRF